MAIFQRSRLNLAYWFALSMGSILVAFASAIFYVEAEDQLRSFDKALYKKGKAIAARSQYSFQQGEWQVELTEALAIGPQAPPPQDELVYARWYGTNGKLLQSVGLPVSGIDSPPTKGFKTVTQGQGWESQRLRQATVPVLHEDVPIAYLQIATAIAPLRVALDRAWLFLALGVPVTLIVIGVTGWFLAGMAMQPIRDAYRRLQRFTADASHELRAPLAAMLSNAQVAQMPTSSPAVRAACLEEVVKAGKSMRVLIDNLLFLARHESQLSSESLSLINLQDVLYLSIQHYRTRAIQQNRQFPIQLPDSPIFIRGDRQLLNQAISNLLDNAFKYTTTGGTIHLRVMPHPQRVILQIEDDGIGIPASDLPHIFERFYRVDITRSRQTGGYGLGLSITQQILEAHGGKLTAASIFGQGTTFLIELPRAAGDRVKPNQ